MNRLPTATALDEARHCLAETWDDDTAIPFALVAIAEAIERLADIIEERS